MVGPLTYKGAQYGGFLRPGDDRDVLIFKTEIEKDHHMKVKELYKAMHDELAADGWKDPESNNDKFEGLYWERVGANGMKEHHIWWRLVYYPNGKDSKYFRWALKVDFQTLAMREGEIAYKGKKKKVDSVDLIIRLAFFLQIDVDDKFMKSGTLKNLHSLYRRHLFKDEIQMQKDKLYDYAMRMQRWIKVWLDMEEGGEQKLHFHPEGGYKDPYAPW